MKLTYSTVNWPEKRKIRLMKFDSFDRYLREQQTVNYSPGKQLRRSGFVTGYLRLYFEPDAEASNIVLCEVSDISFAFCIVFLDHFHLCPPPPPPIRYAPPVTEHVSLNSKSLCKNMARASGGCK